MWPLATSVIMLGQYIEMAILVNMSAIPGDMPLPLTRAAVAAKFPPGSASIVHTDWPIATALPGSP